MKTNQLITEIEKSYYDHFPKSKIIVRLSKNLYPSISINCYLAENRSECINNYLDNDILQVGFLISEENFKEFTKNINLESELSVISLENNHKTYHIKPNSPYLVYNSKKLSFRKTKGNPVKIIKSLNEFFSKLKKSLLEDLKNDNIHSNHIEIVRSKLS